MTEVLDDIDELLEEAVPAPEPDEASEATHPLFRNAPGSVAFKKLRKRLLREVRETLSAYGMVEEGARWLVCVSGGKDSHALLAVLLDLKWRGLLPVDLLACNLDQAQPGFPAEILPDYFRRNEIPHRIERRDTYSVVTEKIAPGQTMCALCSRLRRGHLYRIAREERCQAVVLGHHREDALETFVMNMLNGGRLSSMPPKLKNDAGDLLVLRPLIRSAEADLERFAAGLEAPIIPCNLCGSQDGLERQRVKDILSEWERERPGTKANMLRALAHLRPSHLHDPTRFDFAAL
ncbi:tRNA 2-thiocytidine biosynthesis protein TtcA [Rhodopseudomonas julia]|uniref:tRNA-cytidine(32) 2-sulfurtransferase n=1 Tax=Rhodopseudomonas julia TaxID=200617 RepID=A0ABU0C8G2_9BRAD|nr:tRNA 2-thiocytidine(32) synthetase TtcA [Rhodopseudomonas julia]MDQ0326817.1 tRNA 2-thiocytidine biosynthesis protein TtcA [Rhodopseudomonas julia]